MIILTLAACFDPSARRSLDNSKVLGDGGDDSSAHRDDDSAATDTAAGDSGIDTAVDSGDSGDVAPILIAIDLVSPATGSTRGGDAVTIYGGPFTDDELVVTFAGDVAAVTSVTNTTVDVVTPPHTTEETIDVSVTTAAGSGGLSDAFGYVEPCEGISISPTATTVAYDSTTTITVAVTGCAASVIGTDDTYLIGIFDTVERSCGVYWLPLPSSVDGNATAFLQYVNSWAYSTCRGMTFTAKIQTESGESTIDVTTI